MKKNIILLLSLFIGIVAFTQNTKYVNLNKTTLFFSETGTLADTISTVSNDTTFDWQISVDNNVGSSLYYDFGAKVKEKTGSTGVAYLKISGRKFNSNTWTDIASVKYYGTGSDTTIYFSQTSTKQFYNQYRLRLSRPASTAKMYISEGYGCVKTQ